jgi:hypothetical protein
MSRQRKIRDAQISAQVRSVRKDAIEPIRIEHVCDELWFGERLGQRYNFLEYHFEDSRARIPARADLGQIEVATVYAAFLKNSDSGPYAEVEAPELRAGAIAYLRRRYLRIEPDDPAAKSRRPR